MTGGSHVISRKDTTSSLDIFEVSTIRHAPLLNPLFESECHRPTIRHLPHTCDGVPLASGLFDLPLQCHLAHAYPDAH